MAKTIYKTNEWKTGKHQYSHNEYRQDGDTVYKFKSSRGKFFDGKENTWDTSERLLDKWDIGDLSMPDWLKKYLD